MNASVPLAQLVRELGVKEADLAAYLVDLGYDPKPAAASGLTPDQAAAVRGHHFVVGGVLRMNHPQPPTPPARVHVAKTTANPDPPATPGTGGRPDEPVPDVTPRQKPLKRMRVFTLARELNVENKLLLDYAKYLGFQGIKNQLSGMTDEEVDALRGMVRTGGKELPGNPSSPVAAPIRVAPLLKAAVRPGPVLAPPAIPVPNRPPPPPARPRPGPVGTEVRSPMSLTPDQIRKLREAAARGKKLFVEEIVGENTAAPKRSPEAPVPGAFVPARPIPPTQPIAPPRPAAPPPKPLTAPGRPPVPAGAPPAAPARSAPGTTLTTPAPAAVVPPPPAPVAVEEGMPPFFHHDVYHQFPFPVALSYYRISLDRDPRARVEAVVCAVEALLRYLTCLGAADLLHCLARRGADFVPGEELQLLRKPQPVTLGRWAIAVRELAVRLGGENDRLVRELPVECAPGGSVDTLLKDVINERNAWVHDPNMIPSTPQEMKDLFELVYPWFRRVLWRVRFVRDYVLGYARPYGSARLTKAGTAIQRFHSCVGNRVSAGPDETFTAAFGAKPNVPFVVTPDQGRVLYLWPLVAQRESAVTGRQALYLFAGITPPTGA